MKKKSGFDKSLDKEIFAKKLDLDSTVITVGVYSYNEGDKKLQISRENRNMEGQLSFSKLGRLTKDEAEGILPLFTEAVKFL